MTLQDLRTMKRLVIEFGREKADELKDTSTLNDFARLVDAELENKT